jgi:hypothetical protein
VLNTSVAGTGKAQAYYIRSEKKFAVLALIPLIPVQIIRFADVERFLNQA